jgi:hypothetical protein
MSGAVRRVITGYNSSVDEMSMQQVMKNFVGMGLMALGVQSAWAYSLAGPVANGGDAWQGAVIGYGPPTSLVAPKNIGEEFRRNVPVMYYSFDANFLDFFGSNGVSAVEGSFAVLNGLTNVDSYSPDLSEFPLETRHLNYQAQALGLYDLKSWTLGALMEQLGLTDPVEWTWTLHDRFHVGNVPCPVGMEYLVVQRNFDFVTSPFNQLQYSPYINDVLYSYYIAEACTGPNPLALTIPFAVDPLADAYSPVASFDSPYGIFYTGLTRDDVAGLRYLLTANNINFENPPAGGLLLTTNLGTPIVVTSFNLNTLLSSAQANNPALLPALFPGLIVAGSTSYFTNVCTTNFVATIPSQNYGAPYPNNFGALVLTPVANCGFQQVFVTTFANVITNGNLTNNPNITLASTNILLSYSTNTVVTTLTSSLTLNTSPGQPYPPVAPQTNANFTYSTTTINLASGEYLILPPGACGFNILAELPLAPVLTTNLVSTATNANGFVDTVSTVTSFTPHQFLVQPINCATATPAPGLREGIEKMQFVQADYDSLLGQFFQPVTNTFTTVLVTNSQAVNQTFQRVVTTPDFIFSAADQVTGPSAVPVVVSFARNLNFDTTQVLPGLAGPGLITPSTTITFEKAGQVYYNSFGDVMDGTPYFTESPGNDGNDLYYALYFVWASYDGTTNDPVVYPNGSSIQNLENQILVQIAPTSLANGTNGIVYPSVTFTATGGAFTYSPPPTWSVTGLPSAPSSGLPPGLTLSSGGTLSGTPTQSGTFDFYLIMTDALGRSVQWYYSIIIQ